MTNPSIPDSDFRRICQLVSHDLRNPLAAIVTNLEFVRRIVREESVDPDLGEALDDCVIACEVLRRIVSNFDLLSRGGGAKVEKRHASIQKVVRDAAARCQSRAAQANVAIELDGVDDDTSAVTDPSVLGLALENLLDNALQHAPNGSTVRLLLRHDDVNAHIDVRDQGKPVPTEHASLAVAVEGHTIEGRKPGTRYGRGLTLLVARLAIEAVGGRLEVGSRDGASLMSLTVPIS